MKADEPDCRKKHSVEFNDVATGLTCTILLL
uniref:Villin 2 family protein n=1 Tax=Rhizophora mucronata TaxID=61149 RepID=A0A2P2JHC6_RHIMU